LLKKNTRMTTIIANATTGVVAVVVKAGTHYRVHAPCSRTMNTAMNTGVILHTVLQVQNK